MSINVSSAKVMNSLYNNNNGTVTPLMGRGVEEEGSRRQARGA